jgi:hypothetical protein
MPDTATISRPQLMPLPADVVTVFDRFGNTRTSTNAPIMRDQAKRVGPPESCAPRFTGSPGFVRDFVELLAHLDAEGCVDFRVRQVYRSNAEQKVVYDRFQRWRAAGSPKPGARGYDSATMSTSAASQPNRSFHGAGCAMDMGLGNLRFLDGITGDAALARFWGIAADHGFTPIISEPRMDRSEAWHFDHQGPLRAVRDLFFAHRAESSEYASAAGLAAEVGCILIGTHVGDAQPERLVQARLLVHGVFVGAPDGKIGPKTRAGLKQFGVDAVATKMSTAQILAAMDAAGIGAAGMAAL